VRETSAQHSHALLPTQVKMALCQLLTTADKNKNIQAARDAIKVDAGITFVLSRAHFFCVHAQTCTHTRTHTYTSTRTHTLANTHTHTHTHKHTHTHARAHLHFTDSGFQWRKAGGSTRDV